MQKSNNVSFYTLLGLFIAAFGGTLVLYPFNQAFPSGPFTNLFILEREASLFLTAGILLLIVVYGEKLGLDSIGLHNKHWGKSLLWSLVLMVAIIATALTCMALFKLVGIQELPVMNRYNNISPWVLSVVMLRAGVVEEIFYRGFIMERLEKITGNWFVYFFCPAALFGLLHYTQGIRGMIMAFALGMVLAYAYWKKRDLKMNIIAHFLVDFIFNVLVR